jgi:hypothetical protein
MTIRKRSAAKYMVAVTTPNAYLPMAQAISTELGVEI